ncbi:universal stress protein [Dissulfurirhabdus thermomarina]|uniref:Universal stress protein n=1 Tax=Dissulfurirhabdus thermomarina TaxID=1765737 RepID=A0A6N9TTE0_DISTH|nr:universal stress protein [Dissulfurirhabdus thermomarina]NDY43004.1 universal stress protein [Dissulfurirhabdus thermomarina]NMX23825.1 universal stress protein [Dissulfurirhabdus thermomarina]
MAERAPDAAGRTWRRLLVAVNDTETAMRAVRYVGEIAGCTAGMEVTLLHVYPEPPPDYYTAGRSLDDYRGLKEAEARRLFQRVTDLLGAHGIPRGQVRALARMSDGRTISDAILQELAAGGYGTVVLGKRGVSKAEEFLFGSVSTTVVRRASGCTVWVVG